MHCYIECTLLDLAETPDRPHDRIALVALELARYNIDIAALSETRMHGEDSLTEVKAQATPSARGSMKALAASTGLVSLCSSNYCRASQNTPLAAMKG